MYSFTIGTLLNVVHDTSHFRTFHHSDRVIFSSRFVDVEIFSKSDRSGGGGVVFS